jgi:DNA-binding NtrC family response regulator
VYPTRAVHVESAPHETLSIKERERRTIERALRDSGGNRRLAARMLGMSERTLYRRIKEFGLDSAP